MSKLVWMLGLGVLGIMAIAATSRGDAKEPEGPSQPPPSAEFSIRTSVPLGPNPPRNSNTPYDVGPPEAVWTYERLSIADKAVADRGRDTDEWQAIQDVYRAAALEHSARGKAVLSRSLLGLDDLGGLGVVP